MFGCCLEDAIFIYYLLANFQEVNLLANMSQKQGCTILILFALGTMNLSYATDQFSFLFFFCFTIIILFMSI